MSTTSQGIQGSSSPAAPPALSDSFSKYLIGIGAVVVAFVFVVGIWSTSSPLAGAIIAAGTVVVDSNVKKVQHPTGGVVGEIRVRDGDYVKEGDIVVRLDETIAKANQQIIIKQLNEVSMRLGRLEAERDAAPSIVVPKRLASALPDADIQRIIDGERTLFNTRRLGREGLKSQLGERIAQLKQEVQGLTSLQSAKASEIVLIKRELVGVEELWAKQLTSMTRITTMQREATRLEGERSQAVSQTAQAKGKIAETELQVLQVDQDARTEIMKDLRETQAKEAELVERLVAAEDQLRRIDLRAPQSGVVHQSIAHTVGGVLGPNDIVMLIVPQGDPLVIEAKIAPQDIDHVHPGNDVTVRLSAFNQRTTPEIDGVLKQVAADLTKETQPNMPPYYLARVALSDSELKRLKTVKLKPGMPVEIHIKTSERTALSYFLKPLEDQLSRVFKEQ